MNVHLLVNALAYVETFGCGVAFSVLTYRRQFHEYPYLSSFLGVRFFSDLMMGLLMMNSYRHHGGGATFYWPYFYLYWGTYSVEAVLLILTVYGTYRLAMVPLPGLQRLGMLVFRWAAAISLAVSIGLALGPHVTGLRFIIRLITQLQQTSSILTVCLVLFVCFAIRPMGLSLRSRIFGVSLGLGILATVNLITSAWITTTSNMYSVVSLADSVAVCTAFAIWAIYFALPEPKRRLIVLPTTSPFLRWNQISQILGDEPGYVAIAGVPPEMFADAEIEVMKRASRKMMDPPSPLT